MSDLSLQVKAVVLAALDSSPGITALVPAERIFPMRTESLPQFPFIRYDPPTVEIYENSCGSGVEMTVRVSAFSDDETASQQISAAIVEAVSSVESFQQCDWVRTQYVGDPDPNIYHTVTDFSVIHTA